MGFWTWSESMGKRIGWMVSTVGIVLSATSVTIASCSLKSTIQKNSADIEGAVAAQRQIAIVQALSILRGPNGPGTNSALELIAREGVPVPELRVEGAYLARANLSNLRANGAVFDRANLGGANFTGADIGNASFIGANLSGALLRGLGQPAASTRRIVADVRSVPPEERDPTRIVINNESYKMNFTNSNLNGAALDKSILSGALFRSADLTNSTLSDSKLMMADFTGANTTGADLSAANLGSGTTSARITQQQLDVACFRSGRPTIVPTGLRPPSRIC